MLIVNVNNITILNDERSKERKPAREDLLGVQKEIYLEKKVGKSLGRGKVL